MVEERGDNDSFGGWVNCKEFWVHYDLLLVKLGTEGLIIKNFE